MANASKRTRIETEPEVAEAGSDFNEQDASHDGLSEPVDLEAELAGTQDKLLRALAEQENIRRLMQREREESVHYAASRLAQDLLETLDNLERALGSAPPDILEDSSVAPLLAGIQATERNLLSTLERHGLQKIDPLGERFDPHRHHAMLQRPDADAEEGTVLQVLQPGYTLHDRLLRPAMVEVASRS
jgi:molecular chaperone GrpE